MALGLLKTWAETFDRLVHHPDFEALYLKNKLYAVFMHQAILSALVVKSLDWELARLLPPEYSYPLHFHQEIPKERRPGSLNSLVCPVYEGGYRYPDSLSGIDVEDPLKIWLQERSPA